MRRRFNYSAKDAFQVNCMWKRIFRASCLCFDRCSRVNSLRKSVSNACINCFFFHNTSYMTLIVKQELFCSGLPYPAQWLPWKVVVPIILWFADVFVDMIKSFIDFLLLRTMMFVVLATVLKLSRNVLCSSCTVFGSNFSHTLDSCCWFLIMPLLKLILQMHRYHSLGSILRYCKFLCTKKHYG